MYLNLYQNRIFSHQKPMRSVLSHQIPSHYKRIYENHIFSTRQETSYVKELYNKYIYRYKKIMYKKLVKKISISPS